MNEGSSVFAQIMRFIPWKTFGRIVDRHHGDARVRSLDCADLFRILVFAQLTFRESLRDIEVTLWGNRKRLYHMGILNAPARSTLSDAMNARPFEIYHALAMNLAARAKSLYAQETLLEGMDASIYALDATTTDLCLSVFDWAHFRTHKGAIKLHTLLDLRGNIPAFIHISDGKLHEVNALDFLPIEAGAFYLMDRGYLDFERLYRMHQMGAFFVTRAKSNMKARRLYSMPSDKANGILCDQRIVLSNFYTARDYPEQIRRVRFKDPESGKTLVFLTNNTNLPPHTIAVLYKNRWQVELFFKWIKQHLRIKQFFATSENAVKTQIWCAIATYLLAAIIKKELHLSESLYTLLQFFSVSLFEKTPIPWAFQKEDYKIQPRDNSNQLNLFDF